MINKEKMKAISNDLNQAIQAIANQHGVAMSVGNGSFSPTSGSLKVNISQKLQQDAVTPEANAFLLHCGGLGLDSSALGKDFFFNGRKFKLLGYNPRSRKYPFIGSYDGKKYKLPNSFGDLFISASKTVGV